jgi:predicted MFS family arabinose efflux permease
VPLLVLAATHSPAKAGIAEFAAALPILVLTLPAGALIDRWNRKRLLIVCDTIRAVAYASLATAIATGHVWFSHILAVVAIDGCGFVFFGVAERSAVKYVVHDDQLPDAVARNQARQYAALLGGQPLGGVLYSLGRAVPFLFDAVSYAVSVASLSLVRAQLQGERTAERRRLLHEVREGVVWFWRQPFVRTTSFLVMGSDFSLNALYLVVIVLARERGASPALVGAMFGLMGVSGIAGSIIAPRLIRLLSTRAVVGATMTAEALLLPLLFLPGEVTPGIVYAGMFLLHPAWGSVVMAYRLRVVPDALVGRMQSVATLLALGPVPLGFLGIGFALEAFGTTPTVLALVGLMAVVATTALTSQAVRSAS